MSKLISRGGTARRLLRRYLGLAVAAARDTRPAPSLDSGRASLTFGRLLSWGQVQDDDFVGA
jgi:hypothetical protein